MRAHDEFQLRPQVDSAEDCGRPAAILHCDDEEFLMAEEDAWRGQLLIELKGIRADVSRLEAQIEKQEERRELSAKEAFERLRVVEIELALQKQSLQTSTRQLKRDLGLIAAGIGTIAGTIATAIVSAFR